MEKTTLVDAYLSGPETLRAAVTGVSREQMVSRPVAGRWSVLEYRLVRELFRVGQIDGRVPGLSCRVTIHIYT
jgi:hypothetical protein